jgi:hypothetical protein
VSWFRSSLRRRSAEQPEAPAGPPRPARADLQGLPLADLHALAAEWAVPRFRLLRRGELIDAISGQAAAARPAAARPAEPEPAPAPEPEPEPEPEPVVLAAAPDLPPEPEPELEPEPEPEPEPPRPARLPSPPRHWNVWTIEEAVRASGEEQAEELAYLLVYLRDFAAPDGSLPLDFDDLVRESFGDLLEPEGVA